MLRPMFHHRAAAGRELLTRVQPRLQALFRTSRPVLLQSGAATALMEGAVRSGVEQRLLAVVSGTFGERFADIAERCGKEVIRLHVPAGGVLLPEMLDQLQGGPPVDAVSLVHAETSTGALAPLDQLIPSLHRLAGEPVVIVDAVASIGATPVATDQWDADLVLTASQKAIALPPGLSFATASPRFLAKAATIEDRGRYLDILSLHTDAQEGRYPQTPPIPLLHALDVQLQRIEGEGLEQREARHSQMRHQVETWVAGQDVLEIFAPAGARADGVTALRFVDGRGTHPLIRAVAAAGWTITPGIGPGAEGILRIGHMGEVTPAQLEELLARIDQALQEQPR